MIHLTKVAVGSASVDELRAAIERRAADGTVTIHTRYRPKRAEEVVGGSLFWIIRHSLAARQRIIGFEDSEDGRRTLIRLDARVVLVQPRPKRAHQGWRYLVDADAPVDLGDGVADLTEMPPKLVGELAALALI